MKDLVEEWKDIKNYEGLYQVSNLGNVRSLDIIVLYFQKITSKQQEQFIDQLQKHLSKMKIICLVLITKMKIKQIIVLITQNGVHISIIIIMEQCKNEDMKN